jgi:hypothetical protein
VGVLGHSEIKTTLVYIHASSFDDLAAALDKMAGQPVAACWRRSYGLLEAPREKGLFRSQCCDTSSS